MHSIRKVPHRPHDDFLVKWLWPEAMSTGVEKGRGSRTRLGHGHFRFLPLPRSSIPHPVAHVQCCTRRKGRCPPGAVQGLYRPPPMPPPSFAPFEGQPCLEGILAPARKMGRGAPVVEGGPVTVQVPTVLGTFRDFFLMRSSQVPSHGP